MSPARAFGRTLALLVGLAWLAGCHTYRPVDTPMVGSPIRVQLPVTSALSGSNSEPQTVAVEGVTVATGDTLVLATRTRREIRGVP